MPNGTQAVAGAIVPLFATGVVAHEGRAIMAGADNQEVARKKKKNKKAHLERNRSKGRHKMREVI